MLSSCQVGIECSRNLDQAKSWEKEGKVHAGYTGKRGRGTSRDSIG